METVGLGLYFEDLPVGRQFKTIGRTVTEADITNFVNCTGMVEVLFTNLEFLAHESDIKGRPAPGALVYAFSEGLLTQSTMQHTAASPSCSTWTSTSKAPSSPATRSTPNARSIEARPVEEPARARSRADACAGGEAGRKDGARLHAAQNGEMPGRLVGQTHGDPHLLRDREKPSVSGPQRRAAPHADSG